MAVKDVTSLQKLLESAQIDDYLCDFESDYLTTGLIWDDSDEGYDYWYELWNKDREWTVDDHELISLYVSEYLEETLPLEEDIWL
jgi:hypothetical protein